MMMLRINIVVSLFFALFSLVAGVSSQPVNNTWDNLCFTEWDCVTEDDWTAGWYANRYGCEWTWENRPHLRGSLPCYPYTPPPPIIIYTPDPICIDGDSRQAPDNCLQCCENERWVHYPEIEYGTRDCP